MTEIEKQKLNLPVSVKRLSIILLIVVGMLTVASLFTFDKLNTQYSLKQFLPRENALLALDEQTKKTFYLAESQPFVLTLRLNDEEENWFNAARVKTLEKLTQELETLPGVKSALNIANVKGAISSQDGLNVGPFLKSLPENLWAVNTLNNPLLTPTLVSKDARTASVIINIGELNSHQITDLKGKIEKTTSSHISFAKAEIGGTPAVQSDVSTLLQREVRNFVVLGFFACILVLGLIFSNITPVLTAFVITLCANFITLGAMATLGYSFTVLSTTIPILATVTVVSLCIHTMLRVIEEQRLTPDIPYHMVVIRTLKVLIGTNFLASLTPAIGFLSLLLTNVPLIRDYGLTVAMSIMLSWFASTLLLYPLLLILPAPKARAWAWTKARWGLYFFRRSGIWTLVIIVLASALALKGQSLSWSARLFDDLPTNHQVRLSTEVIDKELGGMIPVDIEIRAQADAWNDPVAIIQLDSLENRLRELEGIGSVMGLPDLLAAANLTTTRLPASRTATAEILFLYSLSSESPLKNFLNTDSSKTRISVRTRDLPANELQSLVEKIKAEVSTFFPEKTVQVGGMGATIHHLNNELSRELIFGFWHAMGVIFILLIVVFGSVRWALVACLPNLVPPAVLLGFLALTQTPIKPSVSIIFSIALGMAFNNTIYLLGRLKHLQKNSLQKKLDIEKTLWLEGNPCLIASLTLLTGFSVFMASYFAMNRIFGFYMLLSMIAGLVGDLILLPTLLKSCPWLLGPITWKKERIMTTTASILISLFIIGTPQSALSQGAPTTPTVEQIGKEVSSRLATKDESFRVRMKIIEADASSKEREMNIQRYSPEKKEHYLLVRMQKPQDLKGTALLAILKDGQEEKWLYLPSSKQTRRLSGDSAGQGGILGSELSPEDFDFNADRSAENTLKKEIEVKGKKYYVIESNVGQTSNNYSKVVSFVSARDFLPIKSECYDKNGKLLKVIDLLGYKKLPDNKYRASKIIIKNVQNKRSTEIYLSQMKINQGLTAAKFTSKNLAED
ncbi:MMPL family protein [compost metagenome]